jgi:hypothetical protein
MKTQLLQDIDDSGGFAAAPQRSRPGPQARPRARPRPAVWHRAQDLPPAGGGAGAAAAAWSAAGLDAASGPPPGAVFDAAAPAPGGQPDWLTELMREDAALAATRQATGRWKRRLLRWTAAAGALALLAGGLWLHEARRVDGALVVVAETAPLAARPMRAEAVSPPVSPPAAARAPGHDVVAPAPLPQAQPAPRALAAGEGGKAPQPTAETKAETKASAERGTSARRRREETLMQCRALGYDERQCIGRGCAMTRFGLACRG